MNERADLQYYFEVLRRRIWVVLGVAVVVAAVAGGLSLRQPKVYEARTQVVVGGTGSGALTDIASGLGVDGARNLANEVQILESRAVRDLATDELGRVPSVRIESNEESDIVDVVASGNDPRAAARDADTYAQAYVDYRLQSSVDLLVKAGREVDTQLAEIDAQLAQLGPGQSPQRISLESQRSYLLGQQNQLRLAVGLADAGSASVLAEAEVPGVPVAPQPLRNAIVGLLLGIVFGIAVALLLEYLDDTVKGRADLELALAGTAPVIAEVPLLAPEAQKRRKKRDTSIVVIDQPASLAAESFGILRTSLMFLGADRSAPLIQVTSAAAGEGKTTLVVNLAASLAKAGKRVVIVDLDLRRPKQHTFFEGSNTIGFTTAMLDEVPIEAAMRRVRDDMPLALMPSGRVPGNPSEILMSPRTEELTAFLRRSADVVLIDSPPVLPVADALTIASMVDMTVLVARSERSSRRGVHRAMEMLISVGAPVVGAVLNAVDPDASYYRYGYGRYAYRGYKGYKPYRSESAVAANGNGSGNGAAVARTPDGGLWSPMEESS